ncbi:hypothetical protein [Glycomyces sp. MUSA5-2]|uniref:hypothetical protein n=1 Tax=Glycomyces sp. MUSA5-2 TaxID=2053002 RepID=UPI003008150E
MSADRRPWKVVVAAVILQIPWPVTIIGGYNQTRCGPDAEVECMAFQPPFALFAFLTVLWLAAVLWPSAALWTGSNTARRFLVVFNGAGLVVFGGLLLKALPFFAIWLALWGLPLLVAIALLLHPASKAWCERP